MNSVTAPDHKNFAPRIGLAARLPHLLRSSRDTVFRAGYGHLLQPGDRHRSVRSGAQRDTERKQRAGRLAASADFGERFPQTASTGFPSYYGVDQHAPTPYVQQWSASIQHELPGSTLFEIAYVGTKGTDLRLVPPLQHSGAGRNGSRTFRPGPAICNRSGHSLNSERIFQLQHIANSIYHSLQIKAEKRFTGRLSFLASFVWAKSIDDADTQIPGLFESFGAQDERNLRLERGLSFFDVRRRLSGGYVYSFPNAPVLRPVLKNWQLSGNLTFQDGTPLNPVYYATDFANSGTPNRPNVVLGQSVLLPSGQRNADHFYNAARVLSIRRHYTFGDAGRDILPGPGNAVVDVALHRRFVGTESTRPSNFAPRPSTS